MGGGGGRALGLGEASMFLKYTRPWHKKLKSQDCPKLVSLNTYLSVLQLLHSPIPPDRLRRRGCDFFISHGGGPTDPL